MHTYTHIEGRRLSSTRCRSKIGFKTVRDSLMKVVPSHFAIAGTVDM